MTLVSVKESKSLSWALCRDVYDTPLPLAKEIRVEILEQPNQELFRAECFGVYGSFEYLNALTASAGSEGRFYFPVVYSEGKVVAVGCFQELILNRQKLDELGRLFSTDSRWTVTLESALKSILGGKSKSMRVLIAGNCQVSGPYGLFFKHGVEEPQEQLIWKEVLRTVEKLHGPYSISLLKDIGERQDMEDQFWKQLGFKSTQALPVMKISIQPEWKGFDDYIAAMASKYRIRAKAALKKGAELKQEIWGVEQIEQHLPEILRLYEAVYSKARFRLQKVDASYFLRLCALGNDRFLFRAWLFKDRLVGFNTCILDENRADAHLIGLDYELNKTHSLYLNMLYQYVADAIAHKVQLLDLGRTAMEIKSTVGAIPVDLAVYMKLKNPLLNGLACMLTGSNAPEPWIQRHPFK